MKILRILMNRIGNLWQSRAKRRKVVTVLACIVVFTTVKDAGIPMGSVLSVSEIGQDTEEYQEYYAKAAETVSAGSLDFARFFDVTISYDGEKLEPEAPVSVQISYDAPLEVSEEQEVQAIHFAESNGVETPELLSISDKSSEMQGSMERVTDITFRQESFSVIGSIVAASSSNYYWPSPDNSNLVMVVTPDNTNYYAVKHDGALTAVTYSNGNVIFSEADGFTSVSDLSDYYWNIVNSSYNKRKFISDGSGHYLMPYYSYTSGNLTGNTQDTLPDYQWNLTPDDSDSKKRTIASSDGTQYIWPEDAVGRTSTNMGSLSLDDQGHLYTTTSNGTQFHYLGMTSGADNAKTLKGDATGTGSNTEVSTSACAVSFYDVALTDVSFESSIVEEVSDNWPSVTYSVGNVMVVKGSGDQYYAVKTDGTLTPVTVETDSSGNKTVVFDLIILSTKKYLRLKLIL